MPEPLCCSQGAGYITCDCNGGVPGDYQSYCTQGANSPASGCGSSCSGGSYNVPCDCPSYACGDGGGGIGEGEFGPGGPGGYIDPYELQPPSTPGQIDRFRRGSNNGRGRRSKMSETSRRGRKGRKPIPDGRMRNSNNSARSTELLTGGLINPARAGINFEKPDIPNPLRGEKSTYVIASTGERYSGLVMEHAGRLVTTKDGAYQGDSQEVLRTPTSKKITNIPKRLTRSSLSRAPRTVFSKMSPGRSRSTTQITRRGRLGRPRVPGDTPRPRTGMPGTDPTYPSQIMGRQPGQVGPVRPKRPPRQTQRGGQQGGGTPTPSRKRQMRGKRQKRSSGIRRGY